MLIINEGALTEAQIRSGKDIADDIVNTFGNYRLNMNLFSNDHTADFRSDGDSVTIPLKGRVGAPKTAVGDGNDDFCMSSKSGGSVTLRYELKYVSAPITVAERSSGVKAASWRQSLIESAVGSIMESVEGTMLAGAATGKVDVLNVGDAEQFTTRTLTRTVRPKIRKPGREPHVWLNTAEYAAVIPLDKEGFDPDGPHYGFSGLHEYEATTPGVVGFAANESAIAYASAAPSAIADLKYNVCIALSLEEVGFSALYCEWDNLSNGTKYGGLFWLQAMTCAKDNSALLLTSTDSVATAMKPFGVESLDVDLPSSAAVSTFGDLTALYGVPAAKKDNAQVVTSSDWLTVQLKTDASAVQYKATANTGKRPRSAVVTVLYVDSNKNQQYVQFTVTQPSA